MQRELSGFKRAFARAGSESGNCALRGARALLLLGAVLSSAVAASPYTGAPIALPGTFQAENFDRGGEGVGYHELTTGNSGGQYRTSEAVDIIRSADSSGGGYVVSSFQTGEWLAYTVDVAANGRYDIELRVASTSSTSAFHIEIDGVNVSGRVAVPNTSRWNSFRWVARRGVLLSAGQHTLKIVADQQHFHLNSVRVTAVTTSTPYSGSPIALPGLFEAENYDVGGEGIAYHDSTGTNLGGQYRSGEGVDLSASPDVPSGGYVVNNFQTGEWLAYTVRVAAAGRYDVELRVSSEFTDSAFHVEVDGVNVTGTIAVPSTGSWSAFQWIGKKGVQLPAGQQVLTIVAEKEYFNLNSVRVVSAVANTPYSGSPIPVPGTFQAENFDRGGQGIAYRDNVTGNAGGQYRAAEDVDIVVSSESGGGYVVNNFETGEWLLYTINVAQSASYDIELRAATMFDNSAFHVEIDGADVTGTVVVPSTGSWSTFQWIGKKGITLAAGAHALKVVSNQQYFDLNSIRVVATAPAAPAPDPGTVQFFCTFQNSPQDCGFQEQAKVAGRATVINAGRDGGTGVRLRTEPGDTNVAGSGDMERNDLWLTEADTDGYQGREHWWAHSMMFPSDFAMPTWQVYVLMDFHQTGGTGSAPFHVLFKDNVWHFMGNGGQVLSGGNYTAPIGTAQKNVWYDFVYHVKWSSGDDGFFIAWVNGVKKLDHRGPTLYAGQNVYLKLANYHTPVCNPYPGCTGPGSSVIHDRIVRGTSALAVSLGPLEGVLEVVNGVLTPVQ